MWVRVWVWVWVCEGGCVGGCVGVGMGVRGACADGECFILFYCVDLLVVELCFATIRSNAFPKMPYQAGR